MSNIVLPHRMNQQDPTVRLFCDNIECPLKIKELIHDRVPLEFGSVEQMVRVTIRWESHNKSHERDCFLCCECVRTATSPGGFTVTIV